MTLAYFVRPCQVSTLSLLCTLSSRPTPPCTAASAARKQNCVKPLREVSVGSQYQGFTRRSLMLRFWEAIVEAMTLPARPTLETAWPDFPGR